MHKQSKRSCVLLDVKNTFESMDVRDGCWDCSLVRPSFQNRWGKANIQTTDGIPHHIRQQPHLTNMAAVERTWHDMIVALKLLRISFHNVRQHCSIQSRIPYHIVYRCPTNTNRMIFRGIFSSIVVPFSTKTRVVGQNHDRVGLGELSFVAECSFGKERESVVFTKLFGPTWYAII